MALSPTKLVAPKPMTSNELKQFSQDVGQQQSIGSLTDLVPDPSNGFYINSYTSNVNDSAHAAMLDTNSNVGQDLIDNYKQALSEFNSNGVSQTARTSIDGAVTLNKSKNESSLISLLADPNVSDEKKQEAVNNVYDSGSFLYGANAMLSQKAASTPPLGSPTKERIESGVDSAKIFGTVNAQNIERQKILNAAVNNSNPSTNSSLMEFGLSLVPYLREAVAAKVASDTSGAPVKAFLKTFLSGVGTSKKWMADQIANLPPDKRLLAAQHYADVINNSNGIVGSFGSEAVRKEMLNDIIGGQYTSSQQLTDNLLTWVQDAAVLAPAVGSGASKLSKFAKAAKAGKSEAEIKAAFMSDFEDNYKAFTQQVPDSPTITPPEVNVKTGELKTLPLFKENINKNSEGQFKRRREVQIYDSSTGIPKRNMPEENKLSSAIRDIIRNDIQPQSVYSNVKNFNPDTSRVLYDAVKSDPSDQTAMATTVANRNEALSGPMLPEMTHVDGSVAAKVSTPDGLSLIKDKVPEGVFDVINHDGMIQYQQTEKAAARSWKIHQFHDAIGMTPRGEMFQIRTDQANFVSNPRGFGFDMVFGPTNNGFSNAVDAMDVARYALRNTGIDESNLTLLRRTGTSYEPTTLNDLNSIREANTKWTPANKSTGEVKMSAVGKNNFEFDLVDRPTTMDTSSYGLSGDKWIREVVAFEKGTDNKIGRLIYTNYDRAPSVMTDPSFRRRGVATGMLKMAKKQGGVLGDDKTGEFSSGEVSARTNDGKAFRSNNNPDDTKVFSDDAIPNDFLISVRGDYRIQPGDVTKAGEDVRVDGGWNPMEVKMNFFDRWVPLGGTQGTFSNILFDQASMLDPTLVGSAVLGADKAARVERVFVKQAGEWARSFKALPHDQRTGVMYELTDANIHNRPYDDTHMAARGMSAEAMDVVHKFGDYQDAVYYFDNLAHNKMLSRHGLQEFVHPQSSTKLPVRKVPHDSVSSGAQVWNPQTDALVDMSKDDVANLYKSGGGIAELRRPSVNGNGDPFKYVAYTDKADDSYLKDFTENSQTLQKRDGYYPVHHKDPYYIIEEVKDKNGKTLYNHAVGKAANMQEAKTTANRMNSVDGYGNRVYYKRGREFMSGDADNFDMDISQAQGRSSFRQRGKLLEDSTTNITDLSQVSIENPMEVMIRQARRLSREVGMSDVVAAMKERALNQYSQYLEKNPASYRPMIPRDMRQIRYRGGVDHNQGEIADARTTFGYINYLENGYVNLVDDAIKRSMQEVASVFGNMKYGGKAEEALMALSQKSLTNGLKTLTYYAYMGTNPLHQLVLQGHQAVLLAAHNPQWVASTKVFSQPMYISMRTLGIPTNAPGMEALAKSAWGGVNESEDVFKQFLRSGISAAVDKQSMISGAVNDVSANMLARYETNVLGMVKKPISFVSEALRKIGFDSGEFYNSSMSWLSHRDKAVRDGLDAFNDEVIDKVTSDARNWTGNMNMSGEMAYNRNALSVPFQYQQNRHKLLLNMTLNRNIPLNQKIRLALFDMGMFGLGTSAVFGTFLNNVPNGDAKDSLIFGLESWMINKALTAVSGGKSTVDWSQLAPADAYGTMEFIHGLLTMDFGKMLTSLPATSMFFGSNPRVTDALKSAARYTHLIDDYDDPTTLLKVATDFAKISSLYSTYFKSKYLFELRKKVTASGATTDENLDKINLVGTMLGLPTQDETKKFYWFAKTSDKRKALESDVSSWYNDLKKHYVGENLTGDQILNLQRTMNEFNRVYGNDSAAQEVFNRLLMRDLHNGNATIQTFILKNCELFNKGNCQDLIKGVPFKSEEDRQNMLDFFNWANSTQFKSYDSKDGKENK